MKLADRRTSMLNLLAAIPSQTVDSVFAHTIDTLKTNPNDVPFAMLYGSEDSTGTQHLKLKGHIGLPESHSLITPALSIESEDGLIPDIRQAESRLTFIDVDDRFAGVCWKGWGVACKRVAILPITSGSRFFGYLIIGTNPYRPDDDKCYQFTSDLRLMVSSIVSAAVENESSKKRQEELEAELAFSDLQLRHLIDHASVGMCHVASDGTFIWANEHYYRLSGLSAEQQSGPFAFFDVYLEEDQPKAHEIWTSLLGGSDHITAELRLKRLYNPPVGEPEPAALQILAFPYRQPGTAEVKSIMACTTDISRLRWAQSFQARLAAEAREAKRQQEAFIDVVSHEMRNPLSAIIHCADAITSAVDDCHAHLASMPQPCLDALEDNISSAKIILQCANHQKRIIDDILTLSKLDSMLLSITPVAVKPTQLIDSIVNIFEAELNNNHIAYGVECDPSISSLKIEYLYFDPSRVTQIFINLLTNAIKFVKSSSKPTISVHFGARVSDPRKFFPETMFWAATENQIEDVTSSPEWGSGPQVYLTFIVKDSGIGLRNHELQKVFERFRQANVKTHVKYGGSGLGLFISKELTEKQGGEIGVASNFGEGSTFGFYVKTRRVERQPSSLGELYNGEQGQESLVQQLHVLLVEDNIINQQVLGKQLKKAGCIVNVANHGVEALNILEETTFDVVLMDLEMPVLGGLGAMRKIRAKEEAGEGLLGRTARSNEDAYLPIIAVTANVRKEQIDSAIAAGANRVMQKPFKAADLVFMMKTVLTRKSAPQIDPPTPGLSARSDGLVLE